MHRPLVIPQLAARAHCLVSAVDTRFDFGKYGVGGGIGRGPAYPILAGGVLGLVSGPGSEFAGSEWGNPGVNDRGQRYRPSYTRLREPGCYAFQVDGMSFSYTVVFRAEQSN